MNENRSIRLWQWSVLMLVVCNMCLILTIWLRPLSGGHPPPHESPRDYMVKTLKFSDEQTKQYDVLVKEHQQAMHRLRDEAGQYHQQFFGTLKNDGKEITTADSMAQLIANNQKQTELVTYKHFAQVRALCTNAQKEEFDNIIGDVMKRMGGPHSGPHPPPPGDAPPPGPPPPDGPPN